jgi:hypothetical protein
MEEENRNPARQQKRPPLLSILCILTFIFSGMSVIGFFAVSVNYEQSLEVMRTVYGNMPEAGFLLQAPRDFFFVSFILSALSLAGAILMWNLRKNGFHIYTASQLAMLAVPLLYFGSETNPLLNIVITALFVYLYARNLKYMH